MLASERNVIVRRRVALVVLLTADMGLGSRRTIGGPVTIARSADADGCDSLALEIDHRLKQSDRLARPIVGIVPVEDRDVASICLIENHSLFLALEVEDRFVVAADILHLDAVHDDSDLPAVEIGGLE